MNQTQIPPLTEELKSKLINIIDTYAPKNINKVLHYLKTGQIKLEELPKLNNIPEVRDRIVYEYEKWLHQENPEERKDWGEIERLYAQNPFASGLRYALEKYINDYEGSKPNGHMLDQAKIMLAEIGKKEEEAEWREVIAYGKDYDRIMCYYKSHPDTAFFNEIDDALWSIVKDTDVSRLKRYIADVPQSAHKVDVERKCREYDEWYALKSDPELNMARVSKYINDHWGGVFFSEAQRLKDSLRTSELKRIKSRMSGMTIEDYDQIIRERLFTKEELIEAGIITESSLDRLRKRVQEDYYVDLSKTNYDCPTGTTDVYFMGIPSTGKTCVLMGLLSSEHMNWNSVKFGGAYGCRLQELCDAGLTPTRTTGNFATLVNGTITDPSNSVVHPVNLIDIAGEGFANKIAKNPDAIVTFADMGTGMPEMVSNSNEKVFFLTIDPTADLVSYNARIEKSDGTVEFERNTVSQKQTFQKFLDILSDPSNSEIMKKVRAIHVIVTKADSLCEDRAGRNDIAVLKMRQYAHSVNKLKELCSSNKYDINLTTNNAPHVLTFSLGRFYMGGIFDYDSTDSDSLLETIGRLTTGSRKHKTVFEKIRDFLNK